MSTALVELGRHGDILNILPLAYYLDKQFKVTLVVHKDFTDIPECLKWCDYIKSPVELVNDVNGTVDWLKKTFEGSIIVSKVDGNPDTARLCKNFCEESYRLAGYQDLYGTLDYPIIHYSKERGQELVDKYIKKDAINILYNLESHSSKFPYKNGYKSMLDGLNKIKNLNFIDIGAIKCTNICDLLALYEKANLLITVDSATLHLSKYSNVKTINLVNDNKWYASDPSKNSILTLKYAESTVQAGDIVGEIFKLCTI
jgi:ADP-heptose:LPS heptosyltransferase